MLHTCLEETIHLKWVSLILSRGRRRTVLIFCRGALYLLRESKTSSHVLDWLVAGATESIVCHHRLAATQRRQLYRTSRSSRLQLASYVVRVIKHQRDQYCSRSSGPTVADYAPCCLCFATQKAARGCVSACVSSKRVGTGMVPLGALLKGGRRTRWRRN